MKKYIILLFCSALFSCNDGDFNVPALDFTQQNINKCGNFVFFKINNNESLIIELGSTLTPETFFLTERNNLNNHFVLSETGTKTITYRVFDSEVSTSYFCTDIPPATPTVLQEWLGNADLYVSNTIVDDDKDGVEETDLTLDTDGDGTPNYIDNDDDGDGILTKDELDANGNPLDTDNDGIFDYLDTDDDGDGVLTINESLLNSDNDPQNIPDYLDTNTAVTLTTPRNAIVDSYTSSYRMTFTLENLILNKVNSSDNITFQTYNYGTLEGNFTITP